jgi:tripartite-type tricarboxylate transporter receptor subunit TctC
MQPDAPLSDRLLKCLPVLLFIAAMPLPASAQIYPDKPMRMLVPYPPGGASDVVARIIGQHMG